MLLVASLCQADPVANRETGPTKNDVAKWTPDYVRARLGKPTSKRGPFKHRYLLNYAGIGFFYAAPNNVESDQFSALIVEKSKLTANANEFLKVVPPGLTIGCGPETSLSILGKPARVEKGDGYVWHTYNHRAGDWRRYWLRFKDGKLDLLKISLHDQGGS